MAAPFKPTWNLRQHGVARIVLEGRHGDWLAATGKHTLWRDLRRQLAGRGFVVAWLGVHLFLLRETVLAQLATLRNLACAAVTYDATALAMFHDLMMEMDLFRDHERERWLLDGFRGAGEEAAGFRPASAASLPPGGDLHDGKKVRTRLETAGRGQVGRAFEGVRAAKLSRQQRDLLVMLLELDRDGRGASLKLLRGQRATRSEDAALSRSLRRLAERGLLVLHKTEGRTTAVRLTEAGRYLGAGRQAPPAGNG